MKIRLWHGAILVISMYCNAAFHFIKFIIISNYNMSEEGF